ncbi:MAG: hypothetical protein ACRD2R_05590, partial [Terriglobales bacterium]
MYRGSYQIGQLIGFQNNFTATVYSLSFNVKPGAQNIQPWVCSPLSLTALSAANVRIVNIPWGPNFTQGPWYYFYSLPPPYAPSTNAPWAGRCDAVFAGGVAKGGSTYFSLGGVAPNFRYWDVTRKDVVAFVDFPPAIAKGQSATATVTLYPSPSPVAVTLNLAATSGTGSAVFTSTNTSTMTVTQSGPVEVKGIEASSVVMNLELSASVSGEARGPATFSVVWVTLALRSASGLTVSDDNAAKTVYNTFFGHTNLGAFANSSLASCHTGAEFVGTLQPSNYTGLVVLRRTV